MTDVLQFVESNLPLGAIGFAFVVVGFSFYHQFKTTNASPESPKSAAKGSTTDNQSLPDPDNNIVDYECIIVGSGLSGLQCAHSLITEHGVHRSKILIVDANNYIGGRVKQTTDFVKGVEIDLGAELIHGNNTKLTEFAKKTKEPIQAIFCWAHGDGGPLPKAIKGGYGLYYVNTPGSPKRLLRFDDQEPDFVKVNKALWGLAHMDEEQAAEAQSVADYLSSQGLSSDMVKMAAAGFSNTFCSNNEELSLKQTIRWSKMWHDTPPVSPREAHKHNEEELKVFGAADGNDDKLKHPPMVTTANEVVEEEEEEECDFRFKRSYACLVDYLKEGLTIRINTAVSDIDYSVPGRVTLTTKDGEKWRAKCAVVTASPKVLLSPLVRFHPPLPPAKVLALEGTVMRRAMKVILKFRQRPWPKDLQGVVFAGDGCPVPECWFRDVAEASSSSASSTSKMSSTSSSSSSTVIVLEEGEVVKEDGDDGAVCIATGFACADYADALMSMDAPALVQRFLAQLDDVFASLEPRHMSAVPTHTPSAQSSSSSSCSLSIDITSELPSSSPTSTAVAHREGEVVVNGEDQRCPSQGLPRPSEVYLGGLVHDWQAEPYIGGGYCFAKAGSDVDACVQLAAKVGGGGGPGGKGSVFFAGEATNVTRPGGTAHAAMETGERAAGEVAAYLREEGLL